MSGLFSTLYVANKGLRATQTSLHTSLHNITNAETDGFSRQRVNLQADLAFTLGGIGQLGSGVKMSGIIRIVDDYVTRQIRQEGGTLSRFSAKSEVIDQLEKIYNDPSETSLNFNLGEMFEAWNDLSKYPEMLTQKSIVVEKSKTMADTLNHISEQMKTLKSDTESLIGKNVDQFNAIIDKLDVLNKQIFSLSVKGQVPNDLMDQRDLLLKDLSNITDIQVKEDNFGRVEVSVKGNNGTDTASETVLDVKGENKKALELANDGQVRIAGGNTLVASKGQIAGYQDSLKDIDEQIAAMDDFAKTMAAAINNAHKDGIADGIDFFVYTNGKLEVNQAIRDDNSLVVAGATKDAPEGDGSRALAISRLRNNKQPFAAGENTIENHYRNMVTKVGISKQHADNTVANQEVLLDQLIFRREAASGVNIDEEISDVIRLQKSFDANARVIQTITEMLDVLINRTGV